MLEANLELHSLNQIQNGAAAQNKIKHQVSGQANADAKWGFLKNIVNIDTFFSSGAEEDEKKSLV